MHDLTTYGECAEILRLNGYAPASIHRGEAQPRGAWAALQLSWNRPENAAALVAVLTNCPAARGPGAPVQDWRATRLTTVTVNVRKEFADDVDAFMLARDGRVVRVATNGERVYLFRNEGEPFSALASRARRTGDARVNSARHFVALIEDAHGDAYEWPRGTLVETRRDELATLNADEAQRLIADFDKWASIHEPPLPPITKYVAKPLVPPGQRLTYGNHRARAALERGGFYPAPVQFGTQQVPRGDVHTWKSHDEHGVGLLLNPLGNGNAGKLTLVEFSSRSAEVAEELAKLGHPDRTGEILPAIAAFMAEHYCAPCQRSPNGALRYAFRNDDYTFAPIVKLISGPAVASTIRVRVVGREGAIVISGDDVDGKPLAWDVDWFAVKRADLPSLTENLSHGFMSGIDQLITSGEALRSKPAKPPRRKRKAAA
jgi:hypothetical protein